MTRTSKSIYFLLAFSLLGAILLGACQGGQITIDVSGDGSGSGDGGTGDGGTVSGQNFFILMIVLLAAMFAMVLVAVSSR